MTCTVKRKAEIEAGQQQILAAIGDGEFFMAEIEAMLPDIKGVPFLCRGLLERRALFSDNQYVSEISKYRYKYRVKPWPLDPSKQPPQFGKELALWMGYAAIQPRTEGVKPTDEQMKKVHDWHKKEPPRRAQFAGVRSCLALADGI